MKKLTPHSAVYYKVSTNNADLAAKMMSEYRAPEFVELASAETSFENNLIGYILHWGVSDYLGAV